MAGSMQSTQPTLSKDNLIQESLVFPLPTSHPAETPDNITQLEQRLNLTLQSRLELINLIECFFNEAQNITQFAGLSYHNKLENVHLEHGNKERNQLNYSLNLEKDYLGELTLFRKQRFTEEDMINLERSVAQLILPLRNAVKYHRALKCALTDPLTNTGNRFSLETTLDREIKLAHRYGNPLSVLMLDLDHFKNINDQFGHAAGDHVLKVICNTLRQCTRDTDQLFRYGGEEFVVLLPQTETESAATIAERIRSVVDGLSIYFDNQYIQLSTSIGGTELAINENGKSILEHADKLLYKAKNNGRNQVQFFNHE